MLDLPSTSRTVQKGSINKTVVRICFIPLHYIASEMCFSLSCGFWIPFSFPGKICSLPENNCNLMITFVVKFSKIRLVSALLL